MLIAKLVVLAFPLSSHHTCKPASCRIFGCVPCICNGQINLSSPSICLNLDLVEAKDTIEHWLCLFSQICYDSKGHTWSGSFSSRCVASSRQVPISNP